MPGYSSSRRSAAQAGRRGQLQCRSFRGQLTLTGELDLATLPELDVALRRAEASRGDVVLDLRAVEFVDVCCAQFIVEASQRLRRTGQRLVVVRGSGEIDWLFALTGADRALELVDDPPSEAGAGMAAAFSSRSPQRESALPLQWAADASAFSPHLALLRPDPRGAEPGV